MEWRLRPCVDADADWILELRAVVMRPDLERLGRFDPQRVRDYFRAGFDPSCTSVIEVGGAAVGCVAVRHAPDAHWIEHFYLDPALQGRGIGTAVLRHAFVVERDGPVEVLMVRAAPQT